MKTSTPKLAQWLGVGAAPDLKPRFNIAPSQNIAVCIKTGNETREIREMRWGLIPRWSKDGQSPYSMINARAETVAEKPSYRGPLRTRRCLIPADGFYEWQKTNRGKKQAWFITGTDGNPLGFAGLWEVWKNSNETIESCTIITTTANDVLRPIHHRMPVILEGDDYAAWLDVAKVDHTQALGLLVPCRDQLLESRPVGTLVNNARNETPECIRPLVSETDAPRP